MNYCPNCGRKTAEGEDKCSYCGYELIIDDIPVKEVSSETIEPEKEDPEHKKASSGNQNHGTDSSEEDLSTILKVLIVLGVIFLPGAGIIFGIISSTIFMNDKRIGYRSFGKKLLIFTIIMMVLWILCCVVSSILSFFGLAFYNV
ncbi:MAG: hypothetical protein VB120_02970 [Lachnospiraceae bacterium]|nr:hypothetical protein [Lachnospiraceae bacterium]